MKEMLYDRDGMGLHGPPVLVLALTDLSVVWIFNLTPPRVASITG